ncbi:hypothetical protein ES702_07858 [subsurface metagenome]
MEKDMYEKRLWCTNCEKSIVMHIPRGVGVDAYIRESNKCPRCGLRTLSKLPKY